ncbi:MAG TPA: hypothetical protein VI389_03075 [Geobacteraceae bacterium]
MERTKTIAANVAVIILVALLLIWGDTWWRQWRQFSKGEQAQAAGDVIGAIAGYESAIHMYTPASPLVERAAGKLWSLGEELERRGDRERALIAYRSLRSSFYAARWLAQPGTKWIERCDAKIAALVKQPQKQGN